MLSFEVVTLEGEHLTVDGKNQYLLSDLFWALADTKFVLHEMARIFAWPASTSMLTDSVAFVPPPTPTAKGLTLHSTCR